MSEDAKKIMQAMARLHDLKTDKVEIQCGSLRRFKKEIERRFPERSLLSSPDTPPIRSFMGVDVVENDIIPRSCLAVFVNGEITGVLNFDKTAFKGDLNDG